MLGPLGLNYPSSQVVSGTESVMGYIYGKRSCITVHHKYHWIQPTNDRQATASPGNITNCDGYLVMLRTMHISINKFCIFFVIHYLE